MSKHATRANSLANPAKLPTADKKTDDKKVIRVVIETPKGCRNKYAFNAEERVFELKTVLPAGMAFPYDFGFVPSTKADDGDPVDVLVLMDEPAFPGCALKCRIIGIIQGKQGNNKEQERNDRVVAIEADNHSFADIRHIRDLSKQFLRELEDFFVNYHELSGKQYQVLGVKGPAQARTYIEKGRRGVRRK